MGDGRGGQRLCGSLRFGWCTEGAEVELYLSAETTGWDSSDGEGPTKAESARSPVRAPPGKQHLDEEAKGVKRFHSPIKGSGTKSARTEGKGPRPKEKEAVPAPPTEVGLTAAAPQKTPSKIRREGRPGGRCSPRFSGKRKTPGGPLSSSAAETATEAVSYTHLTPPTKRIV